MYTSTIRLAGVIVVASTLTGCASMNVNAYLAGGVNLRELRTYNWAPADAQSTGDPRLDNNRFFEERVQAAVEQQLRVRGFEKTVSPDLLVHYHASVTQEIYMRGAERSGGYGEDCQPEVYDEGTLLIDLVDTRTDQLVWRGWAKGAIDGVVDDQKWMERRIDDAVALIMRKLPRRLQVRMRESRIQGF